MSTDVVLPEWRINPSLVHPSIPVSKSFSRSMVEVMVGKLEDVGFAVGADDGAELGPCEGADDGATVGTGDGVGAKDGPSTTAWVSSSSVLLSSEYEYSYEYQSGGSTTHGSVVGAGVGNKDGWGFRMLVGCGMGLSVGDRGSSVGDDEGCKVGVAVGKVLGSSSAHAWTA